MAVILVRHTRPAVAEGVCYGRLDIDAADSFAAEAAAVLAAVPACDRLVTSPARRCRRLADHIAVAHRLPVAVDPALAEMDFGHWEGRTWEDIGTESLDAWAADFLRFRGHGGESVEQFARRVRAALARHDSPDERVLIVCHAGVIRCALAGNADDPEAWTRPVPYGSVHWAEPDRC
ncbi:MAG: alpha-ribazole phosphatase [Planctomycetes bacterium]|nr:alpha-ribazole phosphatase [Planctomycetota bacterium]